MSLIHKAKDVKEMKREGLACWALAVPTPEQQEVLASICEKVVSQFPVVGFNMCGVALIECETIDEAAAVPDVGIIRTKSLSTAIGYRFRRVAFKFFKQNER